MSIAKTSRNPLPAKIIVHLIVMLRYIFDTETCQCNGGLHGEQSDSLCVTCHGEVINNFLMENLGIVVDDADLLKVYHCIYRTRWINSQKQAINCLYPETDMTINCLYYPGLKLIVPDKVNYAKEGYDICRGESISYCIEGEVFEIERFNPDGSQNFSEVGIIQ